MTDKIEVTRTDREAAWPYRPSCYKVDDYSCWMAGKYDLAATVIKGFAHHRLASTPDPTPVAVQGLVEALKAIKHSIKQARVPGNDWRRELVLIESLTDTATALPTYQEQCDAG